MNITRARNYRLYYGDPTQRILDISLDGGRCLLGHNPKGLGKNYKNSISRALYTGFPSGVHGKIARRLRKRFPSYFPWIFPSRASALWFLAKERGMHIDESVFYRQDELSNEHELSNQYGGHSRLEIWRPFLDREMPVARFAAFVLPLPGHFTPQILLFRNETDQPQAAAEPVSPVLLRAMLHVYDLLERAEDLHSLGSEVKIRHRPQSAQNGYTSPWFHEKQWARFWDEPSGVVRRRGPYMYADTASRTRIEPPAALGNNAPWDADTASRTRDEPQNQTRQWREIRRIARTDGVLLPQTISDLIILPSMASDSEVKKVRTILERWSAIYE